VATSIGIDPHRNDSQLLGIELSRTFEIFRWKPRRKLSVCEHRDLLSGLRQSGLGPIHESTLRRLVRYRPAEVHLDLDDVLISNGQNLRVAKTMAVRIASFIRDEDAIGVRDEMDEVESLDDLAVRPATAEVGFTIEPIVEGLVK
jgi:hypothetical protein